MRTEKYQLFLILLGLVATCLFGAFFYREIFPEYRIYQDDYVALEQFRSGYTGEPAPDFKFGIKQIVLERDDKGPPTIDRCISCHVATDLSHFSPTKIARDINGNIAIDRNGFPIQVPNEDYVWGRLDQKIAELTDSRVNEQLIAQGESRKVDARLREAEELRSLKTAEVDGIVYDVTKVIAMHPLIGKETLPFEFHPIEEYGCTSCHSGNGRGLTTEKAHGPVFDGEYENEFIGNIPEFLEKDQENDPQFARMYNSKPGHLLIFQTTPILMGSVVQSKCIQCHQNSASVIGHAASSAGSIAEKNVQKKKTIQSAIESDKSALLVLVQLIQDIQSNGLAKTIERLQKQSDDYLQPNALREQSASQLKFLNSASGNTTKAIDALENEGAFILGSRNLFQALVKEMNSKLLINPQEVLNQFLTANQSKPGAEGPLFVKMTSLNLDEALIKHIEETEKSLHQTVQDQQSISSIATDIDLLTKDYQHGQELFISQACYACHRIAGFSRGGVGPELTNEGNAYPWYIKQKMVWPKSDLKTSTMPTLRLDHDELEDLFTFLLGQVGQTKATSYTAYKTALQQWDMGKKTAWEEPIPPAKIHDLNYSMTVFATEGCSACHRLRGFESNVGFAVEKSGSPDFDKVFQEKQWFQKAFPENIVGSEIVKKLDELGDDLDKHIVGDVRKDSILENIEKSHPGMIEAIYSNFKFADRAKNAYYNELISQEPDSTKKAEFEQRAAIWHERVRRVLMMYIQEYGLGRVIGPRPNWSGVYHTDEWLMEHFHNPSGHVPRSIMPVMPFDDSKFYALTYMLDELGIRNRNADRQVWSHKGFNPAEVYATHCAQCHGDYLQGNGPVAEWIYPIPKNLRNATFLRNLTRERAIYSIKHGVKGTPMPPWGEVGMDKPMADGVPVFTDDEIKRIVDWLFSSLPGAQVIRGKEDVPKWHYEPEDVIEELKKEGVPLESGKEFELKQESSVDRHLPRELASLPDGREYLASVNPQVMPARNPEDDIEKVFDVIPAPVRGPDTYDYYIKKKFYTEENIESGKAFFELNCAVCHGKEADGAGVRAEAMDDAKPRMLINLDWSNSRDDLRLLRSIKYGVPGTAMTPWGDLTTSLQRMQLVMFFRSLVQDQELDSRLSTALYLAFDEPMMKVEIARVDIGAKIDHLQTEIEASRNKRVLLTDKEAVSLYQNELTLRNERNKLQHLDSLLQQIRDSINEEKNEFKLIGNGIIMSDKDGHSFNILIQALGLLNHSWKLEKGQLVIKFDDSVEQQFKDHLEKIIDELSAMITQLTEQKSVLSGAIASPERHQKNVELDSKIHSLKKLKNQVVSAVGQHEELIRKQQELYGKFLKQQ